MNQLKSTGLAFTLTAVNNMALHRKLVQNGQCCSLCSFAAFLDYYDVKYKVIEVNPLTRKELKWSDYKKVPVLVVDGEPLKDSSGTLGKRSSARAAPGIWQP